MPTLHDRGRRTALLERIAALRPDSPRQWGTMTADQMLHHLNSAMELTLGRLQAAPKPVPLPKPLFKWLVINLPWPKGAPTAPELIAGEHYDFEAERDRLRDLVTEISDKPVQGHWTHHPVFGAMSGRDCTRLQHKHIDHHLRQFGV
jgi:hypothetical protein